MVESEAKELSEEVMLGAVMFAHRRVEEGDRRDHPARRAGRQGALGARLSDENEGEILGKLRELAGTGLEQAYKLVAKAERVAAIAAAKTPLKDAYEDADPATKLKASKLGKKLEAEIVRTAILKEGRRIDGRDTKTVRPIEAMVGFLPRAHGSALFTRGETQAIVTTTLGTKDSEQMIDGLTGLSYERFMLHYNFPPYSVGEVGRFGAPGRREVGHGKLAWRAIRPMLPTHEEFPYTIRVLSDITESNGSSSMATVCGASLALMDAGVPMKRPVAGIAMGLILEGKEFAVISDILGDEDHLGDMDFKVAGTSEGITACRWTSRSPASPRRSCGRPRPGEGGPRPYPRRDGQGARPHPVRAVGPRAADRDDADPQGQDPRRHRHRRQDHPRDRRRRPAPRSTSTTRA